MFHLMNFLAFQTQELTPEQMQQMQAFAGVYSICILIFAIIGIAAMWRIFSKADKPGWAAIIPIYNIIVLLDIVGKPWWWLILLLIPVVNFIIIIIIYLDLAKAFGRSTLFGIGLIVLGPIFFLILAFGGSEYQGAPN